MYSSVYEEVFSECIDIYNSDNVRKLSALTEEQKNSTVIALANRLYKMITDKIDSIDYGTIPKSMGNFLDFDHYDQVRKSIETLKGLAVESGDGVEDVLVLESAMNNIIKYKDIFNKGFKLNVDVIKTYYNSIVLTLIADISYFTAVCVEYIKNPDSTIKLEIKNAQQFESKFSFLHNNLIQFNSACASKQIEKTFGAMIGLVARKKVSNFGILVFAIPKLVAGAKIATAAAFVWIAITLIRYFIPTMRAAASWFYETKARIHDYFEMQAALLEANANELEKDGTENSKIVAQRQRKWAERFRKIANIFAIEYTTTKNKTEKEMDKESKKVDIDDDGNPVDNDPSEVLF